MIEIDGIKYRNLQEQVKKNQEDIEDFRQSGEFITDYGIHIVGQVENVGLLPLPEHYDGEYGDCYLVGTKGNFRVFIFTKPFEGDVYPHWADLGNFPAPGPQGPIGPKGDKGDTGRGNTWQANKYNPAVANDLIKGDQALNTTTGNVFEYDGQTWNLTGKITGPQGIQGIQGPMGPQGIQGIKGDKGDTGEPGQPFRIAGILNSPGLLPDPKTTPDYVAYIIKIGEANYDLYVQLQDVWTNVGKVSGVQGPKGDKGETGAQGPMGPAGKQGPVGPQGPPTDPAVIDGLRQDIQANADSIEALDGTKADLDIVAENTKAIARLGLDKQDNLSQTDKDNIAMMNNIPDIYATKKEMASEDLRYEAINKKYVDDHLGGTKIDVLWEGAIQNELGTPGAVGATVSANIDDYDALYCIVWIKYSVGTITFDIGGKKGNAGGCSIGTDSNSLYTFSARRNGNTVYFHSCGYFPSGNFTYNKVAGDRFTIRKIYGLKRI